MKARLVALVLIALVALLEPLTAEAQPAGEIRQIGFLSISPRDQVAHLLKSLEAGLRGFGYVRDKDFTLEPRFADGKPDRLHQLALDLAAAAAPFSSPRSPPNACRTSTHRSCASFTRCSTPAASA